MDTHRHSAPTWRNIRLELAPSPEFPEGSVSRAYLLHLPTSPDGTVDAAVVAANPAMASFKRFWPHEPDRWGRIIPNGNGWALSFSGSPAAQAEFTIELKRVLAGDCVAVEKAGGGRWVFRVAELPPELGTPL